MDSMTFEDVRTLERDCRKLGNLSSEYYDKMMHEIPAFPEVDRIIYITSHCEGKRVLSLGCTGILQKMINKAASVSYGIDKHRPPPDECPEHFVPMDLDSPIFANFPGDPWDVVVAGETLEHLTSPGFVLKGLRTMCADTPLIVSVPNAFGASGTQWMKKGIECVNRDHVAWYSYWTLGTLLRKTGWTPEEWRWYNGKPLTAEGLIVKAT